MSKRKRIKYFKVKYQGVANLFMTGSDVALLQGSGANVKILRKATKEEYDNGEQL